MDAHEAMTTSMRSAKEIEDRLQRLRAYETEANPDTRYLVTATIETLEWVLAGSNGHHPEVAAASVSVVGGDGEADAAQMGPAEDGVRGRVSVLYPMDGSLLPARAWYATALQRDPQVDESDYVEFQLGPSEVCLLQESDEHAITGVVPLFEVEDAEAYLRHLLKHEARLVRRVRTDDSQVALYILQNPFGHFFGIVEREARPVT